MARAFVSGCREQGSIRPDHGDAADFEVAVTHIRDVNTAIGRGGSEVDDTRAEHRLGHRGPDTSDPATFGEPHPAVRAGCETGESPGARRHREQADRARQAHSSNGVSAWIREPEDRKSTRLNSSHQIISYA